MEYTKPTYEEYCKASEFAKVRYRYGIYVQIIAGILLLFLIYYTVSNVHEMKTNPASYAEEKLGVVCTYPGAHMNQDVDFNFSLEDINNGSNRNITSIEK